MKFLNLSEKAKGSGFKIFDSSESIYGFTIENGESFSRKDIFFITEVDSVLFSHIVGSEICSFNF